MENTASIQPEPLPSPGHVAPTSHSTQRSGPLAMLTLLAVVVAMAREAEGASIVPVWIGLLLQLPALFGWCAWRCSLSLRSTREGRSLANTALTLVAVAGGIFAAISSSQPETLGLATTLFVAGCQLVDCLARLYQRLDAAIEASELRLRTFLGPWVLLIVIAAAILASPIATQPGVPDYRHNLLLHIAESAITAVSAACLVGTSAQSFCEDYTLFGQITILLTVHLAGLCFAATGLGIMRPFMYNRIRLRTVLIVLYALQAIAVAAMWSSWHSADAATSWDRFWWGVVQAGGAVWNAGFTMRPDGLMAYMANRAVFASVATLSIVGSLGLPVILDLVWGYRTSKQGNARPVEKARRIPPWCRLPQWEAGGAFLLLLFGSVLLFFLETPWRPEVPWSLPESWVPERPVDFGQNRVCIRDDLEYGQRWTLSVFTSATLRSAGIQSMPLAQGAISWPSWGLLLAGMLIGGSAGGVAGGMRTSAILLIVMCWFSRRNDWAIVPNGESARRQLVRSVMRFIPAWLLINVVLIALFSWAVEATTYQRVLDATAACNSAGISTGLLPHLTWSGRLVMILMMLVGRLVPVAFWLCVAQRFARRLQSPAEDKVEAA